MPNTSKTSSKPAPLAVEMRGVNKRFGAVHANQNIDLAIAKGTIHGIIGENGAGKSTLMSVLYGFYTADSGDILLNGQVVKMANSTQAIAHGVGMVHQHFMLVPTLTALENILLGAEESWSLKVSTQNARVKLNQISEQFGLQVPLDELVGNLAVGVQQRVEILKALYRKAQVLILDEPTGVLTPQEADQLFDVLRDLRAQGVTVLIITHKLREIMDVTDAISVMRGGKMVAHRVTAQTHPDELAELMVGRPVVKELTRGTSAQSCSRLAVRQLSYTDESGVARLKNVSFTLKAGEIVGLAGVSGNGQTELLKILSGELRASGGHISLNTDSTHEFTSQTWPSPKNLRTLGVAHVPEDRLGQGLLKNFSLQESAILGYHHELSLGSKLSLVLKKVRVSALALIKAFDVRPNLPEIRSANMSGGNQQKVVLGKALMTEPTVVLLDEPTRGIDVGAKREVYELINRLTAEGKAVILVSSELPELMGLSDRIIMLTAGRIGGEFARTDFSQEKLLAAAMGRGAAQRGE